MSLLTVAISLLATSSLDSSSRPIVSSLAANGGVNATLFDEAIDEVKSDDRRPHEQRVSAPRKARRLNHPFQHLYRHADPSFDDNEWNDEDNIQHPNDITEFYWNQIMTESSNSSFAQLPVDVETSLSAIHYLHVYGGYSLDEIHQMHTTFPPLLEIDVVRHLRPKMRFLKDCLEGGVASTVTNSKSTNQVLDPKLKSVLLASFFGARFERTIAPRHAFLVHLGLPSGRMLWDDASDSSLLEEFLLQHRKPKQFAALCNLWRRTYGASNIDNNLPITAQQVVAFDKLFQRGILSAARDDSNHVYSDNNSNNAASKSKPPSLLDTANVTPAQLVRYLIQHGANAYETDVRGVSLFHWASGCGNLEGLKELVDCCNKRKTGLESNSQLSSPGNSAALLWKASRDDAIPLHWACAGAGPKEFGIGGSIDVCNYLLSICSEAEQSIITQRKLINAQTRDGNTVLMWSAWSGSLEIVKLMFRNRADTEVSNRNGCTVAHWAASGGNLDVCKYLATMANVNFDVENYARNTPLSHAVAYGRGSVAQWLRDEMQVEDSGNNAENLALDFVNWGESGLGLISEDEQAERKKISELFRDWADEMGEE